MLRELVNSLVAFADACMRLVGITEKNYPNEKYYLFTRSAFIYSWLACSVSIFYTFFYWSIDAKGAAYSLGAMSAVIVITHFLYASGRSALLARIDLIFSCFALAGVVLHTGGINASSAAWLLGTIPGISALLFKKVEYIIGLTALTIFLYSCIFMLEISGFNVHQLGLTVGSTAERTYTFVHFVGFSMFLAVILSIFSITQKNLYSRLNDNKTELERVLANLNIVFQTIDQAIFTIDGKGTIADNRSDKFEIILHKSHKTLYEILHNCDLSDDERATVGEVIGCAIGEEIFQFDMNTHLLPKKINYIEPRSKQEKILSVQWSPIAYADVVDSILIAIQDITDIEIAKHDIAEKGKRNAIFLSLIENSNGELSSKIDALAVLAHRLKGSIEAENTTKIKVLVHTIKGSTRQLNIKSISEYCHNLEDIILNGGANYKDACKGLITLLNEYILVYNTHFSDFKSCNYDRDLFSEIQELVEKTNPDHPLIDKIRKVNKTHIQDLAHPVISESLQIAKDLKKPAPEFVFEGLDNNVPHQYHNITQNILGHLVRNSLDHGLEHEEMRKEKGKNRIGKIYVKTEIDNNNFIMIYSDDGRGLNLSKIEEKATASGIDTLNLNRQKISELIFHEDLSTSSSLTDLSGRGVGMTAVAAEVEQAKGKLDLRINDTLEECVSFNIVINLPLCSS